MESHRSLCLDFFYFTLCLIPPFTDRSWEQAYCTRIFIIFYFFIKALTPPAIFLTVFLYSLSVYWVLKFPLLLLLCINADGTSNDMIIAVRSLLLLVVVILWHCTSAGLPLLICLLRSILSLTLSSPICSPVTLSGCRWKCSVGFSLSPVSLCWWPRCPMSLLKVSAWSKKVFPHHWCTLLSNNAHFYILWVMIQVEINSIFQRID